MLSFILRLMGYDIPDGPIVFVNSTSCLPTTIYDIDDNLIHCDSDKEYIPVEVEDSEINQKFFERNKNRASNLILTSEV